MNALAMHEQKKNYIIFLIVFVIEIIYKMVNFTVNKQISFSETFFDTNQLPIYI